MYGWKDLVVDYWAELEGYKIRFSILILCLISIMSVMYLVPYIMGKIVDFFTNYTAGDPLFLFYYYIALIALIVGSSHILRFFLKFRLYKIAAEVRKRIRVKSMNKLIELDLAWHEESETGAKVQKIHTGSDVLYNLVKSLANDWIPIGVNLFVAFIIFLTISWKYALFAFAYIIIYFALEKYFNKKIAYWSAELNKINEKVSGKFVESASNLLTVKSMGLKDSFTDFTSLQEQNYINIWEESLKASQNKSKVVKTFGSLGVAGFLLLLGLEVASGIITVGSLVTYNSYFNRITQGLFNVTNSITTAINQKTGASRLFNFLNQKVSKLHGNTKLHDNWKFIKFQNLWFKYKNRYVLKDFNLEIKRNQKIGIVGESGSGKSTITKLLLGLYPTTKGNIFFDELKIKDIEHKYLTKNLSVVLQDSEMFNMSLGENILISRDDYSKKDFTEAINISQLKKLVSKLPAKLSTLIGEKGYKLSGGERQRVGIARAIYKNSPVLILDEATSSLDSRTEKKIQEGLEKLERTVIIIAHRLSTLKNVDKIVYLENGQIIEQGTYDELIKKKGRFFKLHKLQQTSN